MPFIPKTPDSCRDLDLVHVSRMLAMHCGDFYPAARELGVSGSDLRRLTWAKPHLLDEAHEEMELVVLRARSELITAIYSGNSQTPDVGGGLDSFELDGAARRRGDQERGQGRRS